MNYETFSLILQTIIKTIIQIIIKMQNKKTIREFWQGLDADEKRKVQTELADMLRRPLATVYSWLIGQRNVKTPIERDAIANYIKQNYGIEIIYE